MASVTPQPQDRQQTPPPADTTDGLQLDLQVCFAVHATARAFDRAYRRLLAELGLTYPQYLAMMALWEHGELPVKRLGELLRLDSGTLSPLLKRLEAAGLVRRERSPQDERSVIIHLTAEGRALRSPAERVPYGIAAASGLTHAEGAELRRRLEELTANLDEFAG
ncbi:MarR family winged helix-turn-helix transcriptional regulator [Kitasatospora sp. LaBMicrA B282]|uniref:MarR family winged helix-turn-helix transcriptional regulator n=1 Tax=Kitasatospora sp. LaBMicrA B282 TaxID=3420949 RepID=UPI003D149246